MQTLGGKESVLWGIRKQSILKNYNNLTAIPHKELQEFYYLLMRRKWILKKT